MAEYIDKSAVINELIAVENRANRDEGNYKKSGEALYKDLCDAEIRIGKMPAADVAPVVHGQWDGEGDGYAETADGEMALVIDVWHCSKCGYCIDEGIDDETMLPNYCPNCGAKMDKEEA